MFIKDINWLIQKIIRYNPANNIRYCNAIPLELRLPGTETPSLPAKEVFYD